MIRDEYTERFEDLPPAQQAAVLAAYEQQVFQWVPVGDAGYVWQDTRPPRLVVRKSTLSAALAKINAELAALGYANMDDIIALFEQEKTTLGYNRAVNKFKERRQTLADLKEKKQAIKAFIGELRA